MLLRRLPESMINMPNKEYWLAPSRKEETLAFNQTILIAVGGATCWLFIALFELTSLVAIEQRVGISPEFWWVMGIYLAFVFGLVGFTFYKMRIPDTDQMAIQ